jgi:hypothetical protein
VRQQVLEGRRPGAAEDLDLLGDGRHGRPGLL